jgi:hypothetical protein
VEKLGLKRFQTGLKRQFCNWRAGNNKTEEWAGTVQVFEVTRDKKIVWSLSAWKNPDLGPATYIQLLDEPGNQDNGDLQR